jgi:CheY-like chemotaxis protein
MSAAGAKILLIDDDPDMHLVVEMMLASQGHQVTCCRTGAAGLEAMRRQCPDLVLLDIMLSQPTEGLQVACQMRQDERLKNIPIIFMSAIGESLGADYAKEVCPVALAADMFLEKPLDATMVREAVCWVLGQKRAGGAAGRQ